MERKKTFFERLTGAINTNGTNEEGSLNEPSDENHNISIRPEREASEKSGSWLEDEEGQLTVDVYQTPTEIVIKTMVAGVKPDTIDLNISRDMVTIKGSRQNFNETREEDYHYKELFWGSFSRTILLPAEIEVEEAEATEEHGLLTLRLPKIDKEKKTKLKVKSSR